jgi:hypothetical protein
MMKFLSEQGYTMKDFKVVVADTEAASDPVGREEEELSIAKPTAFSLDKFKSKSGPALSNVETLLPGLPVQRISDAKDFVRLHPDEENYWSPELCFVSVPIKGQKRDTIHLITEEIAKKYGISDRIIRMRLALAAKPHNSFFLCQVPTRNLDNVWNETSLDACAKAKKQATLVVSRRSLDDTPVEEGYQITFAQDAEFFPEPDWPAQSLVEILGTTFKGCNIEDDDHPGLLRLIGAKQKLT